MKKRMIALLLAGILTASMVSCTTSKDRTDTPTGTEGYQTRETDAPNTDPIVTVTWQDVNETVYVTAPTLTLVGVENTSQTVKVNQMDKLNRIKIGSNGKSIVVVENVQYTVDTKSLNNEDLVGENYDRLSTPQTMYVNTAKVNVRPYAYDSDDETYKFSAPIGTLSLNDSVSVIAKGSQWFKVEYKDDNNNTKQGFVWASCLSTSEVKDPNDISNYENFVNAQDYAEPIIKYVIASESLTLRKCPSADSDYQGAIERGARVLVAYEATAGNSTWSKVLIPSDDNTPNAGPYYVNSKYLSETEGGVAEVTLADILKEYPGFTQLEAPLTLYSTDSLNIRSTPELPSDNSNYLGNYKKADAVKVYATGSNDNIFWALVALDDGDFGFVSYKYLTTSANGEPAPATLQQLLASNPGFVETTTQKTLYAKDNSIRCLTAPENQTTDVKLSANEAVTVVASGSVNYQSWYIYKTSNGSFYFGLTTWFNDNPA